MKKEIVKNPSQATSKAREPLVATNPLNSCNFSFKSVSVLVSVSKSRKSMVTCRHTWTGWGCTSLSPCWSRWWWGSGSCSHSCTGTRPPGTGWSCCSLNRQWEERREVVLWPLTRGDGGEHEKVEECGVACRAGHEWGPGPSVARSSHWEVRPETGTRNTSLTTSSPQGPDGNWVL